MRDYVMKLQRSYLLPAAALMLLLSIGAPGTALAITRVVDSNLSNTCDSTSTTTPCYRNISDALSNAADLDTIEIHPGAGPYTGTFSLTKKLTIVGTETASTILDGGGSGPIITVDNLTSIAIRRLSFQNASTGVLLRNSASAEITNSAFRVTGGTALDIQSSSSATITNNTFYNNSNGISFATGTSVTIVNNIFANNTGTAVSALATGTLGYNCFFSNGTDGQIGDSDPAVSHNVFTDPKFVKTAAGDFHLQTGSSCIDTGTGTDTVDGSTADIGAYGGSNSDTIPFQVTGVSLTDTSVTPNNSIRVTWSPNNCYLIGGYKVYSGTSSGVYGTPADTLSTSSTYDLLGLNPPVPSAPVGDPNLQSEPSNQTLLLSWTAASGATGYEMSVDAAPAFDIGDTTSYTLTGLTNNTNYTITVTPFAQSKYYVAVTAYYNTTAKPESALSSETSIGIGTKVAGTSSSKTDYPEAITAYPNLQNKGCFIATAAYGYYSAPQVRALREFRDRYLVTNAPGRAFVGWYYTYGPAAAQFISKHPDLKPVVRVALLPAVGAAMFMTRTSALAKTILFVLSGLLALYASLRTVKMHRN
jgi:parallel beta-helix repeat protein